MAIPIVILAMQSLKLTYTSQSDSDSSSTQLHARSSVAAAVLNFLSPSRLKQVFFEVAEAFDRSIDHLREISLLLWLLLLNFLTISISYAYIVSKKRSVRCMYTLIHRPNKQ